MICLDSEARHLKQSPFSGLVINVNKNTGAGYSPIISIHCVNVAISKTSITFKSVFFIRCRRSHSSIFVDKWNLTAATIARSFSQRPQAAIRQLPTWPRIHVQPRFQWGFRNGVTFLRVVYRYGCSEYSNLIALYILKLDSIASHADLSTKSTWIIFNNVLAIISKYFIFFGNVQIEVIYQLQCICCPICKPLIVEISQYTFFANLSSDIWWSRFMKRKADMWHALLPYSNFITSCAFGTHYTADILQEERISVAPKLGPICPNNYPRISR